MKRSKQYHPLPAAIQEKLLELAARIIVGGGGPNGITEPEALDILEAVALNTPVQVIAVKIGRARA